MSIARYILLILVLAAPCHAADSAFYLHAVQPELIDRVVFGSSAMGSYPTQDDASIHDPVVELFTIKDTNTIRQLLDALKQTSTFPEPTTADFDWSLISQYYITADGTITLDVNVHESGKVFTGVRSTLTPSGIFKDTANASHGPSGENPPYTRMVYWLLVTNASAFVREADDRLYRKRGGLRHMLHADSP